MVSPSFSLNSSETNHLLERAALATDRMPWTSLLERHRPKLRRMLALRLDTRLDGHINLADLVREVERDAFDRRNEYLNEQSVPFFVWLRSIAGSRLKAWHRKFLGSDSKRGSSAVSICREPSPAATTAALAAQLLGQISQETQAAERAARKLRLQEALDAMRPLDREVLALRHFERLSNAEAACVLGLPESVASTSYIQALKGLKTILSTQRGPSQER